MEDVTLWKMSPYGGCDLQVDVTLRRIVTLWSIVTPWRMSPYRGRHPMEDVTW